jgi:hypothetical protein
MAKSVHMKGLHQRRRVQEQSPAGRGQPRSVGHWKQGEDVGRPNVRRNARTTSRCASAGGGNYSTTRTGTRSTARSSATCTTACTGRSSSDDTNGSGCGWRGSVSLILSRSYWAYPYWSVERHVMHCSGQSLDSARLSSTGLDSTLDPRRLFKPEIRMLLQYSSMLSMQ